MSEHDNSWISIADVMSALMMIFMFIAVAFLYQIISQKQIYRVQLNQALHEEFNKDLPDWKAMITEDNIIRFDSPFEVGSDVVPDGFKKILDDFFPRYIKVLTLSEFKKEIEEIRVEGHTSNGWGSADEKYSYLYNMELSQKRTSNVLSYCYSLEDGSVYQNIKWLQSNLRAIGMSFSNLLYKDSAKTMQDGDRSRRVEFKVVTKEHFE
ncbi:MAG: OmpA family protein [Sulfurimonas sp.]|uniref:OmpA/MotB family protein n=1 Tax=Sulfurimonas sp. TaxID=2022749 RepID=UPI00260C92E8|nr:OmpA family protein [Sulfurimonas sp.]MDD2653068.1 OmpA family protein [Sulfurimonas sp.]MDD3452509.1 OmpA family protein [Sulfurimonas sp.]